MHKRSVTYMADDTINIDMKLLAKGFLDEFPIYIQDDLKYLKNLESDIIDYVETHAAKVTPFSMIITQASYTDLYDTMSEYVLFEIKKRIQIIFDNLEKDDKDLQDKQYFEIQVEPDGD